MLARIKYFHVLVLIIAKKSLKKNICSSDKFVSLSFVASAVGGCAGYPKSDSISKITYAGQSTLITGDFELNTNAMKAFLQKAGPDLKSQIYRLSHHGALHANPKNFLSSIQAEYVFSSSGYRYGHPRCEIPYTAYTCISQGLNFAFFAFWKNSQN